MSPMLTPVSYVLQMPPIPPEPAPGCAACAAIAERRARAQAEGDGSRVSDCNIWIGRHEFHTPPAST